MSSSSKNESPISSACCGKVNSHKHNILKQNIFIKQIEDLETSFQWLKHLNLFSIYRNCKNLQY